MGNNRVKKAFVTILCAVLAAALLLVCIHFVLIPRLLGSKIVSYALEKQGCPYVFNREGPDEFDCSGLVRWAYAKTGIDLNHCAEELGYDDRFQTVNSTLFLLPGDLVFFDTIDDNDLCDHVGIWIGHKRFVHASSSEKRVTVSEMNEERRTCFSWGKRVLTFAQQLGLNSPV